MGTSHSNIKNLVIGCKTFNMVSMRLAFVLACVAFVSVSASPAYFLDADLQAPSTEGPTTSVDPKPTTSEDPKPTTSEDPKPTTSVDPKPTTSEDPKPTTREDPKPTTSEEPKPTSTGEPKSTTDPTSGTNHLNMSYGLLLSMSSLVFFYIF